MPPSQGFTLPAIPAIGRAVSLLLIHCSATPSGLPIKGGAAAAINLWHRERGFRRGGPQRKTFNPQLDAIGYHFVVDVDGTVHTGRHVDELGAHCAGHNSWSLGICLVGGAERSARYTGHQWTALAALVLALLPTVKPGASVLGHRDLSPDANGNKVVEPSEWLKTCPGFDVREWVARGMLPLANQVAAEAKVAA